MNAASARRVLGWMALPGLIAASIVVAAPAQADPQCPATVPPPSVNPDCYFLGVMHGNGMNDIHGDAAAITRAHQACDAMSRDRGPEPIVDYAMAMTQLRGNGLTVSQATTFANTAAVAYCPWVHR